MPVSRYDQKSNLSLFKKALNKLKKNGVVF